jgi:hypothetical protein
MAATGHITAEQLGTVVQAIMDNVVKVVKVNDAGDIVEAHLGDLAFTYFRQLNMLNIDNGTGVIEFDLPTTDSEIKRVMCTDGSRNIDLEKLRVGILANSYVQGGSNLEYTLPYPPLDNRAKAMHPTTGGGIILSTRFRAYESVVYTQSPTISSGALDVTATPYTFTVINNAMNVNITLNKVPNEVNEFWIDINFVAGTPSVAFGGNETLVWPNGEPDWSTMANTRVQLHIMNGMVWFVSNQQSEQSDPTPIEND